MSTPLTGRKYVQDNSMGTPVSTATQSVGRLHSLLTGLKHGPSTRLVDILRYYALFIVLKYVSGFTSKAK